MLSTEENIIDCLYNDTTGRNEDIVNFYRLLLMQESSGSIAIDGRWGSGKTFFVNQYVGNKYNVIIGKCEFTKESKDFAIRISSMLSRYADFSL